MNDDVVEIPPDDLDGEEGWIRRTAEPNIGCVEAVRQAADGPWQWSIGVSVMEFVREDPLESRMRAAIDAALRAVSGVTDVAEEDREIWIVDGQPSGWQLVQAVAKAVDSFANAARKQYEV